MEDANNGNQIGALLFGVTLGQQVLGYVKVGNYEPGTINYITLSVVLTFVRFFL
jgi:hypothetical protein